MRRRRVVVVFLAGAAAASIAEGALAHLQRQSGEPAPWLLLFGLWVGAAMVTVACASMAPASQEPPAADPPHLARQLWQRPHARWWGGVAAACTCTLIGWYALRGYAPWLVALWLGAWAASALALWPFRAHSRPDDRLDRLDAWTVGLLIGLGVLLYLLGLGQTPYKIEWDELSQIGVVRTFLKPGSHDLFGLVQNYWGLPNLGYWLVSRYALLTGTGLQAMRAQTALVGIAALPPFYLLVRALFGQRLAGVASLLLACHHVMIGWNRMSLVNNTTVLISAAAFWLLMQGLRRACAVRLFWGGLILALGFYTYQTARMFLLIWLLFLAVAWGLKHLSARQARFACTLSLLGFLVGIAPLAVTAVKQPQVFFQRLQAVSIWNPKNEMKTYTQLPTQSAAIRENTVRSLLVFNAKGDPFYYNPDCGMFDPLSGVLLWVGIFLACSRWRTVGDILGVLGVGVIWLLGGFLSDRSPTYSRLLSLLPFAVLLCARGLQTVMAFMAAALRRPLPRFVGIPLALMLAWNLVITARYLQGKTRPFFDPITVIGRYLIARPDGASRAFVLVSTEEHPLFPWKWGPFYEQWIVGAFADSSVVWGDRPPFIHYATSIDALLATTAERPFTVFLIAPCWDAHRASVMQAYPQARVSLLSPDLNVMAVVVP